LATLKQKNAPGQNYPKAHIIRIASTKSIWQPGCHSIRLQTRSFASSPFDEFALIQ